MRLIWATPRPVYHADVDVIVQSNVLTGAPGILRDQACTSGASGSSAEPKKNRRSAIPLEDHPGERPKKKAGPAPRNRPFTWGLLPEARMPSDHPERLHVEIEDRFLLTTFIVVLLAQRDDPADRLGVEARALGLGVDVLDVAVFNSTRLDQRVSR
jgi:hypothetical protein